MRPSINGGKEDVLVKRSNWMIGPQERTLHELEHDTSRLIKLAEGQRHHRLDSIYTFLSFRLRENKSKSNASFSTRTLFSFTTLKKKFFFTNTKLTLFSIKKEKMLEFDCKSKLKDYSRPLKPTLLCSLFTFTILK